MAEPAADDPDWTQDDPATVCPRCGAPAGVGGVTNGRCAHCRHREEFRWDGLTRLGVYEPPLSDWIKRMKFGREWPWAEVLGPSLAEALHARLALESSEGGSQASPVLIPVPLHRVRRWRRGFDQAALLAHCIAKAKGWPVLPMLHRVRATPPQSGLLPSKRVENVRGAFRADAVDLSGHTAVLVDDVKTTGATLGQGVALLRELGAAKVHVAVLAVADPKGQSFKTTQP